MYWEWFKSSETKPETFYTITHLFCMYFQSLKLFQFQNLFYYGSPSFDHTRRSKHWYQNTMIIRIIVTKFTTGQKPHAGLVEKWYRCLQLIESWSNCHSTLVYNCENFWPMMEYCWGNVSWNSNKNLLER